jgi:hypothetical protein
MIFDNMIYSQMLKLFMDLKGKFPNKLIRNEAFEDQKLNSSNSFLHREFDNRTERVRGNFKFLSSNFGGDTSLTNFTDMLHLVNRRKW